MVKLIPGTRGSGKTKLLIEAIKQAKNESKGNVVTVQIGRSLNSHVKHDVRLVNVEDYAVCGCEAFSGFAGGIMASDYDCTHIFVDGVLRIVGESDRQDMDKVAAMLDKIHKISGDDVVVTLTFSADVGELSEKIKKYL
ncbi:MAG: hypothetical protein FWG83_02220 [Oscillospiraceae bacterium]|nr:hypothetical protein [Oscillospiraceae bacterium]